jgi:hypothetical protein
MEAKVSYAALLSNQAGVAELVWHDVTRVSYKLHGKEGKTESLRVDYYSGLLRVGSEWICLSHIGYARQKAESWWLNREQNFMPANTHDALDWLNFHMIEEPVRIATRQNGKYTQVQKYEFNRTQRHQKASGQSNQTSKFDPSKLPTVQQLRDRHL